MAGQDLIFDDVTMEVVRFCAIECELQMSGERSVWWMVQAWDYALGMGSVLTVDDVLTLGRIVEPVKNKRGFREVVVRVGSDVKGDWRNVPRQMANLVDAVDRLTPAEWFREYEEVHPFIDGNGRTGAVLYNWIGNTLHAPEWAPNFWGDPRRIDGFGAPRGLVHFNEDSAHPHKGTSGGTGG